MNLYQQFIAKSRYARYLDKEKRREHWPETVARYFDFMTEHLKERCNYDLSTELRSELEQAVLNLEVMPSMRLMMTAGPAVRRNHLCSYNCSFISISDPKAFDELLFCLMCGTGVGFSVERQNTNKLPEVPEALFDSETTVVVSDSKEGWAKGLRQLIALLYSGEIPKWDLHKVREAGSRLKTFGGRASGPRPLDDLFRFVVGIFKQAVGRKLTSLECHDLCCKIAEVVVVGGSRRSALISLSNLSDERMRKAKSGEWWNSSPERSLANNSAVYTERPEVGVFMKEWLSLYESKSGERGIFNRKAAEKQAERTGRRKSNVSFGTNPCQPGWATVLTPEGIRRLDDVGEGSVIWSGQHWTRIAAKWSTGVKPVFDYVTGWGRFTGTSNHRVVQFGEKVEVKDAICIDPSPDPFNLCVEFPESNPITEVIYLGDHEVFDLTVEAEEHTYWTGGLLVSNCGEVVLRSQGLCNLTEVVCRPEDTELDLVRKARLAAILGTFQSTLTYFPYVRKGWVSNAEEERLLGVSLTGICDCSLLNNPDDEDLPGRLRWLKDHIIHVNQEMADKLGINPSVATTVVKPSGCQRMDTLIPTSEGLLTLAELGQSDNYDFVPFPETMTVSQGLGSSEATHFKGNGFVKTLKINLSSGLSLEATPNHQYKVLRQGQVVWAAASDIAAGDKFPYRLGGYNRDCERPLSADHHVACNAEVLKYPKHMCPTLAWFLGVYTGDGSNHRKGIRIACDSSKPEHIAKVKAVVLELFGKTATVSMPSNPKSKGLSVDISSTPLLSWLRHNGLAKNKTAEVEIPLIIRASSSDSLNAFMDGYNAADGCYSHIGMTWCTVSEKMAVQAVVALRSLGRDAVIYKMPPTKTSWGKKMRYSIQERKGLLGNRSNAPLDYRVSLSELKKEGYESHLWDVVTSIEESMCHTGDLSVPEGNEYLSNSYISHNTVSQLVQSSSGIHPAHARYYIRRVRNDNKDPLTQLLKDAGVPNEPCVLRGDTTTVFSFPMKTPPETLLRKDLSALDHFKLWLIYKQNYTEHNPSITISVRESEWPQVGAEVWKNFDEVLGVSFLPYNDKDHVYKQAPYEEISEEKYNEMASQMPDSIDWDSLMEEDDNVEGVQTLACTGGFCEI